MIKKSYLTKDFYKPGEVAKMLNLTTRTIQNYCMIGKLTEVRTTSNRRQITKESLLKFAIDNDLYEDDSFDSKYDIIYARVSTSKQKNSGDLDRQVNNIKLYIVDKNPKNIQVYTDVASGLNDNRAGLNKVINAVLNNEVDRIFISYKDRLTRFGYNYLKQICDKYNTKIVVISTEENNKKVEEELAEDIISIIHSFSGKLYGMRRKVKEDIDKELD